jgi:hypothetical protein
MQATTRALVAAAMAGVVCVTGSVVVLRAQSPGPVSAVFVDKTTPPPAAAGDTAYVAAHDEIASDYRDMAASFGQRDPNWVTTHSSPALVFTSVHGQIMHVSDLIAQAKQTFAFVKRFQGTITLDGLSVQGTTATVAFETDLRGVTNAVPNQFADNSLLVTDEQLVAQWQQIGGRWTLVSVNERRASTTINGQPRG